MASLGGKGLSSVAIITPPHSNVLCDITQLVISGIDPYELIYQYFGLIHVSVLSPD